MTGTQSELELDWSVVGAVPSPSSPEKSKNKLDRIFTRKVTPGPLPAQPAAALRTRTEPLSPPLQESQAQTQTETPAPVEVESEPPHDQAQNQTDPAAAPPRRALLSSSCLRSCVPTSLLRVLGTLIPFLMGLLFIGSVGLVTWVTAEMHARRLGGAADSASAALLTRVQGLEQTVGQLRGDLAGALSEGSLDSLRSKSGASEPVSPESESQSDLLVVSVLIGTGSLLAFLGLGLFLVSMGWRLSRQLSELQSAVLSLTGEMDRLQAQVAQVAQSLQDERAQAQARAESLENPQSQAQAPPYPCHCQFQWLMTYLQGLGSAIELEISQTPAAVRYLAFFVLGGLAMSALSSLVSTIQAVVLRL